MSAAMQKLRSFLPGTGNHTSSAITADVAERNSIILEPEVGFQITIELTQHSVPTSATAQPSSAANATNLEAICQQKTTIPELNVHLLAARHLPHLFGFKVVQGYQIKVKLFPGSKRLDSTIQTNSWPKFNENFRFPLAPDIKPSLKHSARRSSKAPVSELFTPEEVFAGQFVVFTVYALLELPPASFNRFNKTYRSLRDKSTNLVQKVVESSSGKGKNDKENDETLDNNAAQQKPKRKSNETSSRDSLPPLTISESRRNLGSVTCYLEPKIFKRNLRTGLYMTEELWLPIKDITTTAKKNQNNDLTNAPKGVVEIILEVKDASKLDSNGSNGQAAGDSSPFEKLKSALTPPVTPTTPPSSDKSGGSMLSVLTNGQNTNNNNLTKNNNNNNNNNNVNKIQQWNRMTAEVKRKMGMSNVSKSALQTNELLLRITTARMRCTQKAKDELEGTAGSVYVKTAIFEHGIYVDSWKSTNFYPSLSTKWNVNDEVATLCIPLQCRDSLEHILIRTTLATKTKLGKKLVLGTVLIGAAIPAAASGNGAVHMQQLRVATANEPVSMWHSYQ